MTLYTYLRDIRSSMSYFPCPNMAWKPWKEELWSTFKKAILKSLSQKDNKRTTGYLTTSWLNRLSVTSRVVPQKTNKIWVLVPSFLEKFGLFGEVRIASPAKLHSIQVGACFFCFNPCLTYSLNGIRPPKWLSTGVDVVDLDLSLVWKWQTVKP